MRQRCVICSGSCIEDDLWRSTPCTYEPTRQECVEGCELTRLFTLTNNFYYSASLARASLLASSRSREVPR